MYEYSQAEGHHTEELTYRGWRIHRAFCDVCGSGVAEVEAGGTAFGPGEGNFAGGVPRASENIGVGRIMSVEAVQSQGSASPRRPL